jgi:hypothetical protein
MSNWEQRESGKGKTKAFAWDYQPAFWNFITTSTGASEQTRDGKASAFILDFRKEHDTPWLADSRRFPSHIQEGIWKRTGRLFLVNEII